MLSRKLGFGLLPLLLLMQPAGASTAENARQLQALQQIAASLDARLTQLEASIQQNRHTLGLLQEIESLKAEVARLRGQAEVQSHEMETLGKRQNDLYVDLDQRLVDLSKTVVKPASEPAVAASESPTAAPAAPATSGAAPGLDPSDESRIYETALTHFREANYPGAIAGFRAFVKAYPDSALVPNALYWMGYAYHALKDYKSAIAQQQKLVASYPANAKVPDAMLNIASSQIALGDLANARKTLEALVARHPGTPAGKLAARRLSTLK